MKKQELINILISQLQETLDVLIRSAVEAKEMATSEESKAENKYDTRGLEASYLAGAQAKRAEELKATIKQLQDFSLKDNPKIASSNGPIGLGSIIRVLINGNIEKTFFMLPFAGGNTIKSKMSAVTTITPSTPVGQGLMGMNVGDSFDVDVKDHQVEYEVLEIE